jgi:trehalose-6-phosphatase
MPEATTDDLLNRLAASHGAAIVQRDWNAVQLEAAQQTINELKLEIAQWTSRTLGLEEERKILLEKLVALTPPESPRPTPRKSGTRKK